MLNQTSSIYPRELACELLKRWNERGFTTALDETGLQQVLDIAYQASLLREEGERVQLRLYLCGRDEWEADEAAGPDIPDLLRFVQPLLFNPQELQKLAGAAGYYRAMICVESRDGELVIWGLLLTGTRWANRVDGGRDNGGPLPEKMVVHIRNPGHLMVAHGYTRVLETAGGQLLSEGFDPFLSQWLPQRFQQTRSILLEEVQRGSVRGSGRRICDSFVRSAAQNVIRRVLSLVRTRGHGGILVYIPDSLVDHRFSADLLRFRVICEGEHAARRYRRLLERLLRRLLFLAEEQQIEKVTWEHYQMLDDRELAELDSALIDFGHFLADLMSVDGALVLDVRFRILGFGAEILGGPPVTEIHRALDVEADRTVNERADTAGTRHRSVYRFVGCVPEAVSVVVSQDGGVQFVAQHRERLTYWPYLP